MRSVEEWEADPRQDAACDAALTTSLPPAAEVILAEMRLQRERGGVHAERVWRELVA